MGYVEQQVEKIMTLLLQLLVQIRFVVLELQVLQIHHFQLQDEVQIGRVHDQMGGQLLLVVLQEKVLDLDNQTN
jgi:hypothetical protein